MHLPFTGSVLSWSHRGRILVVDVHAPPSAAERPTSALVEWEALARYLISGADDASGLLFVGDGGIDAGLCIAARADHGAASWSVLPGFVSNLVARGAIPSVSERVAALWQAIRSFDPPSVAVVDGVCTRGGLELVGAVDRVIAERRPGLGDRLGAAGIGVSRWVEAGSGRRAGLAELDGDQPLVAAQSARQSVYASTRSDGAAWSRMSHRSSS